MNKIQYLRKSIRDFYGKHGKYPSVKISRRFWEAHANEIADLFHESIDIRVIEELVGSNFIIGTPPKQGTEINTLEDLKEVVDRLVAEGKGDWPVRQMLLGVDLYMPLRLYSIVPGQAPYEGLELAPDFPGAPPGEHILIMPEE